MNHPACEDLISYLYNELDAPSRIVLSRHLDQCSECTVRLAVWSATGQRLNTYAIAARPSLSSGWGRWTRWVAAAAAAAVVLTAGFALGRFTGASRSELTTLRNQMRTLAAQLDARAATVARAEAQHQLVPFANGINDRLQLMQAQQATDYAALHKELETVAVLTDASFRHTENQIVQLAVADNTVPANSHP